MRRRSIVSLLLVAILGLAGCSNTAAAKPTASASPSPSLSAPAPAPSSKAPSAAASPETTPPAPAEPVTAIGIAEQLQAAVSSITAVTEVTAENDPTGSIGQPGQYTSSAWIADTGAAAPENSVVGGAVVEVFATEAKAQARLSMLQEHFALGAAYKREYEYLRGTALLRVSGKLGDQQAALYEQAFNAIALD